MKRTTRPPRVASRLALLFALSGALAMLLASPAAGAAIPGATYDGSVTSAASGSAGPLSFTVSPDGGAITSVSFPQEVEGQFFAGHCIFFFYPPETVNWPIANDVFSFSGTLGSHKVMVSGSFTGTQTAQGTLRVYETSLNECDSGNLSWSAATTAAPPPPPAPPAAPGKGKGKGKATGRAVVNGVAPYRGRRALLRMRCPGATACKGVATLWFNRSRGRSRRDDKGQSSARRNRRALVGKSRFTIPAGKSRRVYAKLTGRGKGLLRRAQGHRLRVQLRGQGLKRRTVLLKPARG